MTRSLGIRGRVIGLAIVPVAIIGVLLMFQLITGKIDDLDQSLRTRALAIARQLAPAAEYGVASGNIEVLQTLLEKAAIEPDVRGVAVNPEIIKTLMERNWVRVVGHRDVPGHPELLGTTSEFLDYFSLKSIEDLPPLAELKSLSDLNLQLPLPVAAEGGPLTGGAPPSHNGTEDGDGTTQTVRWPSSAEGGMMISVSCRCGRTFEVEDEHAGSSVRCPRCQGKVAVPLVSIPLASPDDPGATIDASNDASWTFPVGTKLWKEFSLPHRRVEARFILDPRRQSQRLGQRLRMPTHLRIGRAGEQGGHPLPDPDRQVGHHPHRRARRDAIGQHLFLDTGQDRQNQSGVQRRQRRRDVVELLGLEPQHQRGGRFVDRQRGQRTHAFGRTATAARDHRHLRRVQPLRQPATQHRAGHVAASDQPERPGRKTHASPCVSISAAASASRGLLPPQSTNWNTG